MAVEISALDAQKLRTYALGVIDQVRSFDPETWDRREMAIDGIPVYSWNLGEHTLEASGIVDGRRDQHVAVISPDGTTARLTVRTGESDTDFISFSVAEESQGMESVHPHSSDAVHVQQDRVIDSGYRAPNRREAGQTAPAHEVFMTAYSQATGR